MSESVAALCFTIPGGRASPAGLAAAVTPLWHTKWLLLRAFCLVPSLPGFRSRELADVASVVWRLLLDG